MIQLAPIVLSSLALMASGKANPLYAPNPILTVACSIPSEYGAADGGTQFPDDPFADTNYTIYLDPSICRNLNRFARAPRLRGANLSNPVQDMAWSLRVATHEASHVFLYRSPGSGHTEKQADCRAVMNVARFARKLGASGKTAQRVYRLNAAMALDEDYASPCANGRPFEITPSAPR